MTNPLRGLWERLWRAQPEPDQPAADSENAQEAPQAAQERPDATVAVETGPGPNLPPQVKSLIESLEAQGAEVTVRAIGADDVPPAHLADLVKRARANSGSIQAEIVEGAGKAKPGPDLVVSSDDDSVAKAEIKSLRAKGFNPFFIFEDGNGRWRMSWEFGIRGGILCTTFEEALDLAQDMGREMVDLGMGTPCGMLVTTAEFPDEEAIALREAMRARTEAEGYPLPPRLQGHGVMQGKPPTWPQVVDGMPLPDVLTRNVEAGTSTTGYAHEGDWWENATNRRLFELTRELGHTPFFLIEREDGRWFTTFELSPDAGRIRPTFEGALDLAFQAARDRKLPGSPCGVLVALGTTPNGVSYARSRQIAARMRAEGYEPVEITPEMLEGKGG